MSAFKLPSLKPLLPFDCCFLSSFIAVSLGLGVCARGRWVAAFTAVMLLASYAHIGAASIAGEACSALVTMMLVALRAELQRMRFAGADAVPAFVGEVRSVARHQGCRHSWLCVDIRWGRWYPWDDGSNAIRS